VFAIIIYSRGGHAQAQNASIVFNSGKAPGITIIGALEEF
jgi:hypothetical protein